MPTPRLSTPDAARRRFHIRQWAIMAAFAFAVIAAVVWAPRIAEAWLRWPVVMAPVALLALWGWEFFKIIRDDDEMMGLFQLRVTAFSAVLVLLGATMWGMLETLVRAPALPPFLLLPLFAIVHGLVWTIANARR